MGNKVETKVVCTIPTEDGAGNAKFLSLVTDTERKNTVRVLLESDRDGPLPKTFHSAILSRRKALDLIAALVFVLNQFEDNGEEIRK